MDPAHTADCGADIHSIARCVQRLVNAALAEQLPARQAEYQALFEQVGDMAYGNLNTRLFEPIRAAFKRLPSLSGRDNIIDFLRSGGFRTELPLLAKQTHFSADVLGMASNETVVFTERVDHHWDEDGRDLLTPHIAGVMEVHDGRITALRDYYDTDCYLQQPKEPDPAFARKKS